MKDADGQVLGGLKLLGKGWSMYALHVRTYLLLMIFVVLAQVLMAVFAFFVIIQAAPGMNLREVFIGMSTLQKLDIIVVFFLSLAVFYRALAGSMLATSEYSEGREMGALEAFKKVGWKHTRLFWLAMTAIFFGRFAPFVALLVGFFFASAFPTAVMEDLGAFQALKCGEKLGVGNQLRIATMYVAYLAVVTGVGAGIFKLLVLAHDQFGNAWYGKLMGPIAFLIFFTVVQWYMIVLALNCVQQRKKLIESQAPIAVSLETPGV